MQRGCESLIRDSRHEDLSIIVFNVRDCVCLLWLKLQHCFLIGFIGNRDLRMRNAVKLQHLQTAVVYLHNRRNGIRPAAALNR
jgi:hypothetical protein